MHIVFYSAKNYDKRFFERANEDAGHELDFLEAGLSPRTASLAEGADAVCAFVNDDLGEKTLPLLAEAGVRLVLLRCAGFNNVDLGAAEEAGLTVMRVPEYSPHAVAEHAVGLMLALNRKLHRAHNRVREKNFSLGGLLGFDMHGKTAGVVGTGNIGSVACRLLAGFGCEVLAHSRTEKDEVKELGVRYVELEELLQRSRIVTLHLPLTPETHHLIDESALAAMRDDAMLVNTSRGKLVDTRAAIEALKKGRLGSMAIDVYEEEGDLFYQDLSDKVLEDDVMARLLIMPNVLVTSHQAFFTREALRAISSTTLQNAADFEDGRAEDSKNIVRAKSHHAS